MTATWDDERKSWVKLSLRGMLNLSVSFFGKNFKFGLDCAVNANQMWQGGNQWSGYSAYLSFFRHVSKLPLDYSKWYHWEVLSEHSGPRVIHPEFCIISDRPEVLLVDDQNRPHCDNGPFCKWRDGSALYAVHGVRVPWWIIENPEKITVEAIDAEQNTEVRRVMMDKYGLARYLDDSGAVLLDSDETATADPVMLYRKEIPNDEPLVMIRLKNSTPEPSGETKIYTLRVPPDMTKALDALAWTFGMEAKDYRPRVET